MGLTYRYKKNWSKKIFMAMQTLSLYEFAKAKQNILNYLIKLNYYMLLDEVEFMFNS